MYPHSTSTGTVICDRRGKDIRRERRALTKCSWADALQSYRTAIGCKMRGKQVLGNMETLSCCRDKAGLPWQLFLLSRASLNLPTDHSVKGASPSLPGLACVCWSWSAQPSLTSFCHPEITVGAESWAFRWMAGTAFARCFFVCLWVVVPPPFFLFLNLVSQELK